jgi:CBS domain-containing protein
MNPLIRHAFVSPDESIYHALKVIGQSPSFGGPTGIVLVVQDDNHLLGILTDGDIRTLVLDHVDLEKPIRSYMNKTPIMIN